jgi:hypothetical protein
MEFCQQLSRACQVDEYSFSLVTTKLADLQQVRKGAAQKPELFTRNICVLHNFIIEENCNCNYALLLSEKRNRTKI